MRLRDGVILALSWHSNVLIRPCSGSNYVYKRILPGFSNSSRLEFYLQLGTAYEGSFQKTQLLAHLLRKYSRRLGLNPDGRQSEFSVKVHTAFPVHGILISYLGPNSPTHAETRVETFLAKLGDTLRSMTEASLERDKLALVLSPWAPDTASWTPVEAHAMAFCHGQSVHLLICLTH